MDSGIIEGYQNGTFGPDQKITHQEAITMLSNSLRLINPAIQRPVSDRLSYIQSKNGEIQVDEWALDAATMAIKHEILIANDGFTFQKDAYTTRGETALMIARLLENAPWPE
ncbi:hypothetical protein D3C73_1190950 [compost metagenome]